MKTCAGVTCQAGEKCLEGECKGTGCGVDCPAGQVCSPAGDASVAGEPDTCNADGGLACSNGAWCDPTTGACGNDPCTGVKCPAAQQCVLGECQWTPEGGTDGGGGTDAGGSGGSGAKDGAAGDGGTSGSAGSAGSSEAPKGVWGLATGGGGCACSAAGERERLTPAALLLMAIGALGFTSRRRRGRAGASSDTRRAGDMENKGDWS
ncbi:MAG: hypothetical protein IT375_26395 [Polyangiaceae bacterium]|nr:hypothetical protein [Polyangiaceae bacterium]